MSLASFYRKFIKFVGAIITNIIDFLRKGEFAWTEKAEESFQRLKVILQTDPVLKLPDFNILFEIECDISLVGVGAILIQAGHPIAISQKN